MIIILHEHKWKIGSEGFDCFGEFLVHRTKQNYRKKEFWLLHEIAATAKLDFEDDAVDAADAASLLTLSSQ